MNIKRKNHYVPIMYLKKWHSNNQHKIFVYSLLVSNENVPTWNEQSISRTASQDNLYLHIKDDKEFDDIEQEFDSEFESKAQAIIDKACSNQKIIESEWGILVDYIAAQAVRTPAFYHQSKPFMEGLVPKVLEECLDGLSNLKEPPHNSTSPLDYADLIPLSLKHTTSSKDSETGSLEAQTVVGKNTWLFLIKHSLSKNSPFREKLKSFHWSIADAPNGIEWPTSDNPVIIVSQHKNGIFRVERLLTGQVGLNQKNLLLLFPISPKKILISKTYGRYPARFTLNNNEAILIRKLIVKNAFLYVYHNQSDKEIEQIRPRKVDENEYKRLHDDYNNWYETYLKDEGSILKSIGPLKN